MKPDEIKGIAVVSIADGAKLGYIDEVLIDTQNLRIEALQLSSEGQQAVLPYGNIKSIGRDAITVPDREAARWGAAERAVAGLLGFDAVKKLKVVDEAGTYHGTINDVELDPESGQLTTVHAQHGGVLGLGATKYSVNASDVISVGEEVMVVSTAALGRAGEEIPESTERSPTS
jgi:sporulation protein YlmC with PRC-barrel domain